LAGKDKKKDQSYFLAELGQDDLSHTLFPIGNITKDNVRLIAKRNKFPNWNKQGTRGICFVGNVDFGKLLEKKIKVRKGKVISFSGEVLGEHKGAGFYTIGQKAGEKIGISIRKPKGLEGERFYVAGKDMKKNLVVVAPEGHSTLCRKEISLKSFHLINPKEKIPSGLKARIRHLGELHSGRLVKKSNGQHFVFSKPVRYVASGQFLVLYKGEKVVGCGEIRL
jgi:tRNA-uridine 2-sulfurtransferase